MSSCFVMYWAAIVGWDGKNKTATKLSCKKDVENDNNSWRDVF